jgi:hypothetical protein
MKRLIKQSNEYVPQIGDVVIFKNHPYDKLAYTVKEILPDGSVFMENNQNAYTGIRPSKIKPLLE